MSSQDDKFEHHGIKGQKWGVRRFQIDEILKFDFAGIYRRINEGDKVSVDDSDETEDVDQ